MADRFRFMGFCFLLLIAGICVLPGAAFCQTAALSGSAQTTGELPRFESAEAYVSPLNRKPDFDDMSGGLMAGGVFELRRATMLNLIRMAYGVLADKVVGGPNWIEMDRFDIVAQAPADASSATVRLMLRALLAERFKLLVHNDTRPLPAFALTAAKRTMLKHSADATAEPNDSGCKYDSQDAQPPDSAVRSVAAVCHRVTMASFVAGMSRMPAASQYIGTLPVVDQTNLEGSWDFSFKYNLPPQAAQSEVAIVTVRDALEKQVGLKLDAAMVATPVIVVDSVEEQPGANPPGKTLPAGPPRFEVADIRQTDPDYQGSSWRVQKGGRVTIRGVSLKAVLGGLWGFDEDRIIGAPNFSETDRWDIVAKTPVLPSAPASLGTEPANDLAWFVDQDTLIEMEKTLLAERFGLRYHMEERSLPAWVMTAAKPKMKRADTAERINCKAGPATLEKADSRDANPVLGRQLTCQNVSMAQLAERLQILAGGYVHSPVLDATGLEGGWDFTLRFSTPGQLRGGDAADPSGGLSLPNAMERQLGVKMELKKRPVEVLVIDHLDQKPSDN